LPPRVSKSTAVCSDSAFHVPAFAYFLWCALIAVRTFYCRRLTGSRVLEMALKRSDVCDNILQSPQCGCHHGISGGGDGAGLFPSRARDVRGELAHVGCACVLESTLCTPIAQPNTRALPPSPALKRCCPHPCPQPSSGRRTMATPLEDSVRDGAPAKAGAPSTGGVHSSCCVAVSHRAARAPRPAAARWPEGPGSTRGQTVDNREPDRAFALYRALFGIDELTQEKGTIRELRSVHPKKYAKVFRGCLGGVRGY